MAQKYLDQWPLTALLYLQHTHTESQLDSSSDEGYIPEVAEWNHGKQLDVGYPHDTVVLLYPVASVQHRILVHQVLGPHS